MYIVIHTTSLVEGVREGVGREDMSMRDARREGGRKGGREEGREEGRKGANK